MKIGILTYHACYNYGACLQAYAFGKLTVQISNATGNCTSNGNRCANNTLALSSRTRPESSVAVRILLKEST